MKCDVNSYFSKKYFYKNLTKTYNSHAFTAIISHEKCLNNNTASQIFTKNGPLAFLPISNEKTSIVYSIRYPKNINLLNLIKNYNSKYKIKKISKISTFELKAKNLRNYYYKNILAFGDLLHKIHPLAGQGFNMSIRDIKLLMGLIKSKLDLGLVLDSSICADFEKNMKHRNFIFSSGIDFIYEFFNFESKTKSQLLSKSVKSLGRNKYTNKFLTNLADSGILN